MSMAAEIQCPQSITTVFLDEPPSCLQFCPASPNNFLVGTYLLTETRTEAGEIQQQKTGSVQLWRLDPDSSSLYEFVLMSRTGD